jgi:hypothetical protein
MRSCRTCAVVSIFEKCGSRSYLFYLVFLYFRQRLSSAGTGKNALRPDASVASFLDMGRNRHFVNIGCGLHCPIHSGQKETSVTIEVMVRSR